MKKLLFLAVICLLASASPVSAQLIIRNSGHAEVGVNPSTSDLDSVTVLKLFGKFGEQAAGARASFGDTTNVMVGELGTTNTDRMWLHGKNGLYVTTNTSTTVDTVFYIDPSRSPKIFFYAELTANGLNIPSDERFKENIEPVEDVLGALTNLEAVSYNYKESIARASSSPRRAASNQAEGDEHFGFLAQNVKDVFPQLVCTDDKGYMYIDYIGLIPILVQSINELQARLDAVESTQQDVEGSALLAAQQTGLNELDGTTAGYKLYQNSPNPWNSETVIRYCLPQNVAAASIYIYDMQGKQLKNIPATGRGESSVTLGASGLQAGMYLYALVADGQLIDSKQMILTK